MSYPNEHCHDGFRPGRLWSVWELMEDLKLGELLKTFHGIITVSSLGTDDEAIIKPAWRSLLDADLQILLPHCERLGLVVSAEYVRQARKVLDTGGFVGGRQTGSIARITNMIVDAIEIELRARPCFAMRPEHAAFYSDRALFGQDVEDCFPSASPEISEAGKCFALARYSAAVYHLMRCLEVGLNCLAANFKIPFENQNWQNILDQIEKAVNAMTPASHGPTWKADQHFYSEAATYFRLFKNAWRNYAMHLHERYDEERAQSIYDNVRSFMRHLATKLYEENSLKSILS